MGLRIKEEIARSNEVNYTNKAQMTRLEEIT
jgi:hypothetical protein